MIITRRTLTASALVAATTLALGACGSSKPQTPAAAPTAEATTAAPTQSATPASVPTVPGYRPGEIPPVPLFSVPAIDVFASNADKAVVQAASSSLASVPGVTVSPAKCDGTSLVSGSTVLGGDGSAVSSSDKGTVVNDGTGSGVITEGPISIIYGGDGSGTYSNADTMVTITVKADGSGTYSTTTTSIILDGNGGGNYSNATSMESIINNGDGSGQFSKGTVTIINNAKVPTAHIYGHTDSISDEAFNLQLSQERADAVSAELKKDGVSAILDATGYGESKPVAPNENADGSDNPAGRALNRRVEIFIPAF